jgi:murein DD-endopeptidase MepM/ murein hydrolase activator NlpD
VNDAVFARRRLRTLPQRSARKPRIWTALSRAVTRAVLAALAFAFVGLGGADGALRAGANSALAHLNFYNEIADETATAAAAAAPALIWTIDVDADGLADFSNPTHGAVRGVDAFGSGRFGALRDAGKRRHLGVDYVAAPGASVLAPLSGKVTQIGFAYDGAEGLRYIEIANPQTNFSVRVLYVAPSVAEGDMVSAGEAIGVAQDLAVRYPGITNHVHVELRDAVRRLVDASEHLPSAPMLEAERAAGSGSTTNAS